MCEMTVTKLRAQLLDVIRRLETGGEEVTVLRHGRRVAKIVPLPARPSTLLGVDRGRIRIVDPADDLLSTGETWRNG
jgi:prevent-host-death family protein